MEVGQMHMRKRLSTGPAGLMYWALIALVLVLTVAAFAVGCGDEETSSTTVAPATTAPVESSTTTMAPVESSTTTAPAETTTTEMAKQDLILATTTSTQDSGLLDVLIPAFNEVFSQYTVKVIAVGSGEALKMGETGDADVLLVHSPAAEKTFMENGFGCERKAVMYNDFIIVGPEADPGQDQGYDQCVDAFTAIATAKASCLHPRRQVGHLHQGDVHLEGSGHHARRRLVPDDRPGHGRHSHHRRPGGRLHAVRPGHLPQQEGVAGARCSWSKATRRSSTSIT